MCGIVGIVDRAQAVDPDILQRMCQTQTHRGPDDSGVYFDHNSSFSVGLGSQRLSILDLSSAGHMPMSNAAGDIWITYNGELYNHLELRAELERKGYVYSSRTDTETVLYAYQEYGLKALDLFNGIFAFAIYDIRKQQVLLARDRMGIKPLYYHYNEKQLVFASELKSILKYPGLNSAPSPEVIGLYLALGFVPSPYSMAAKVKKLRPGEYLLLDNQGLKSDRYWQAMLDHFSNNTPKDSPELIELTRQKLETAVQQQLMSDVPVGILLSGGLDSTIVAAIVRKYHTGPLNTFSVGFQTNNSKVEDIYNLDRQFAAQVSERLGTTHHEIVIGDEKSLLEKFIGLAGGMDEPSWEPSYLSIDAMCRQSREHGVKVLLSGDGSDELFGGYPWYMNAMRLEDFDRIPFLPPILGLLKSISPSRSYKTKAQNILKNYRRPMAAKYAANYFYLGPEKQAELGFDTAKIAESGLFNNFLETVFADSKNAAAVDLYGLADLVLWVMELFNQRLDRMSMAHSVEVRVPFQDNNVVDLALSISAKEKIQNGVQKYLLREAFGDIVPREVIERPKRPFAAPGKAWLQGTLKPFVKDTANWKLVQTGVLEKDKLAAFMQRSLANNFNNYIQCWVLLGLEFWLQSQDQA